MGLLRTAARALLLRGAGAAQLLSELDPVAARIPGARRAAPRPPPPGTTPGISISSIPSTRSESLGIRAFWVSSGAIRSVVFSAISLHAPCVASTIAFAISE
nr:hypothetical protein [Nocardia carnea]